MNEKDWRSLIRLIRDGSVVPVIGPRLLLDADGTTSIYARVARILLDDYDADIDPSALPPFRELHAAVTHLKRMFISKGKPQKVQDLYGDVDSALSRLKREGLQVPTPLRQLAQIADFRLLVQLTPDDLMARALREQKRGVNEVIHSPKLPTSERSDLGDWTLPGSAAQLLYLFGKARPTPLFAIHDEDALEYAHNIIAHGSHAPDEFLGALRERNLLLIGCNFPDWLSRFVLRAARKERLADQRDRREWLVERLGDEDAFIGFLGAYSPDTEPLTNVEPAQFVEELHTRWMAERTTAEHKMTAAPGTVEVERENALFFISYSREDLAYAQRFVETLRALGVAEGQIWFDLSTINPGDNWAKRMLDGVRTARYFVPLVSRAATEREQGTVFREWDAATEQLPAMNRTYLVPLVLDEQNRPEVYRQGSVAVWREKNINFGHAPGGEPDEATRTFLKGLVRESRSRE